MNGDDVVGNIERAVELEDFAIYCEAVSIGPPTAAQRGIWQERADWARACAADFRGAVEDAEVLARAVSASLTHGEQSPLATALSEYLERHPWSDL